MPVRHQSLRLSPLPFSAPRRVLHLSCGHRRPAVVQETLLGAIATQLLQPNDEVVSLFHRRLEHGYPTPSLDRDAVLEQALPWLQQSAGIWSRGRFGSYKVWLALRHAVSMKQQTEKFCRKARHPATAISIFGTNNKQQYALHLEHVLLPAA